MKLHYFKRYTEFLIINNYIVNDQWCIMYLVFISGYSLNFSFKCEIHIIIIFNFLYNITFLSDCAGHVQLLSSFCLVEML